MKLTAIWKSKRWLTVGCVEYVVHVSVSRCGISVECLCSAGCWVVCLCLDVQMWPEQWRQSMLSIPMAVQITRTMATQYSNSMSHFLIGTMMESYTLGKLLAVSVDRLCKSNQVTFETQFAATLRMTIDSVCIQFERVCGNYYSIWYREDIIDSIKQGYLISIMYKSLHECFVWLKILLHNTQ